MFNQRTIKDMINWRNVNNMINRRNFIFAVIIVLFAGVILFASQYYISLQNLKEKEFLLQKYQYNEKVLNFTKLFITKVLQGEGEVSFEDRLKLENAIRDINNDDIFKQWQNFLDSRTEAQAQEEVKKLLEMLIDKIAR